MRISGPRGPSFFPIPGSSFPSAEPYSAKSRVGGPVPGLLKGYSDSGLTVFAEGAARPRGPGSWPVMADAAAERSAGRCPLTRRPFSATESTVPGEAVAAPAVPGGAVNVVVAAVDELDPVAGLAVQRVAVAHGALGVGRAVAGHSERAAMAGAYPVALRIARGAGVVGLVHHLAGGRRVGPSCWSLR